MEYFAVTGGRPLAGEVRVHGAKNSALPILAATLLVRGESVVHNCPALTDIQTALDILSCLGCQVRRTGETVTVDAAHLTGAAIPDELMGKMRASVLFLGALLARQGEASACWPGVRLLLMYAAATPDALSAMTWSFISDMRGETTSVTPSSISAGSW